MIIHLFPKSQFVEEYICFINSHFETQDHEFILYTNVPFEVADYIFSKENVYDYDNRNIWWLLKRLKRADRIIIHNLGLLVPELTLFFVNGSLIRKSIWLVWGADLYCYLDEKITLADKIVELMRRRIIGSFPIIASLTDGDYELALKWYNCKGTSIRLDYCEENTIDMMDRFLLSEKKEDGTVRILLGNSATRSNQHKEAIRVLERFKNENIMIYTPLSYGDQDYADEVIKEGKSAFGEKFIPLTSYMTREEYYKILYDIDIGVFNNNRQQGTGNIEALLYFGRKIYLRDDTTMWSEWVEKEGYFLNRITELSEVDLHELVVQSPKQCAENSIRIKKLFDRNERVKEWHKAFEMPLQ